MAAVVVSGLTLAAPPGVSWTVTRSPTNVEAATPTQVVVSIQNTSQSVQIGCIRITVPAPAFSVLSTAITAQPPSRTWTVSATAGGSQTTVIARATNGGATLRGGTDRDRLGVGITVSGDGPGSHTWTAAAYDDTACQASKTLDLTASFTVTVNPPPPTPSPKPPPPTPSPEPTAAPTPKATPTQTPTPRSSPTVPPSSVPGNSAAPTLEPSLGPSHEPSLAPAASPTAETSPTAPPRPAGGGSIPTPEPSRSGTAGIGGWIGAGDDPFTVPVTGTERLPVDLSSSLDAGLLALQWGVPAVALSVPGLLIIVVVLAQTFGGLAWLPFVRRWIGTFGIRRRRRP